LKNRHAPKHFGVANSDENEMGQNEEGGKERVVIWGLDWMQNAGFAQGLTGPKIFVRGTGPYARLSMEFSRLSPRTKYWSLPHRIN
jgi:hypothetical protein